MPWCSTNQPLVRGKPQYVEDPKTSKKDKEKAATEFNQKEKTLGQSGAKWLDVQYSTGKIRIWAEYENKTQPLKIEDSKLLRIVGKGSFGQIIEVRNLRFQDWWTLGVLYEMLTRSPLFYNENTNEINYKILSEPLHFPSPDIVPPSAKDILTKLLNRKAQATIRSERSL